MTATLHTTARPLQAARRQFMVATGFSMSTHGIWVPAVLLFFHYARGLPLAGTGVAMTVGGAVSLLVATPLSGVTIDRYGPLRVKSASSLLIVTVYVCFLHTGSLFEVAMYCGVAHASNSFYFASDVEAVRRVTESEADRDKVFANLVTQRVIGFGAGAGIGGLILAWSERTPMAWTVLLLGLSAINLVVAAWFWHLRWVDDRWDAAWHEVEERTELPTYLEVLRDRWFLVLVLATTCVSVTVIGLDTALPIYLVEEGLPAWSVTGVYAIASGTMVCLLWTVPRLVDRFGRARLMVASSILAAIELAAFWSVDAIHGSTALVVGVLVLATLLYGVSSVFSDTLPNTMVYDFAPEHTSGRHSALSTGAWSFAGTVCPMLYTALLDWRLVGPLMFSVALMMLAVGLFASLRQHERIVLVHR